MEQIEGTILGFMAMIVEAWHYILPFLSFMNARLSEGWVPLTLVAINLTAGLILLGGLIFTRKGRARLAIKWGRNMSRRGREIEVNRVIGQAISDAIQEAEFKELIKPHERNMWMTRFANILSMPDLLPQRLVKTGNLDANGEPEVIKVKGKTLKEKARERLALGFYRPVPLPDLQTPGPPAKIRLMDRFKKVKPQNSSAAA